MSTAVPADIDAIRHDMSAVTGSPLGDIGSAPDARHLASGGYHCGAADLFAINAAGNDDYSIRQPRDRGQYNRDRANGRSDSSAIDYPDDWPNGGRDAWIRFNRLLRHQLGIGDPALSAIRGMNYTPDGTTKRRFDCLTGVESATTDTVTWHTHIELWRDTIAQPQRNWCRLRLVAIARSAITGTALDAPAPVPAKTVSEGESMLIQKAGDNRVYLVGAGGAQWVNSAAFRDKLIPATGPVIGNLSVEEFDTIVAAHTVTATPNVDAAAVAAALVADPALGQLIRDQSFAADQDAENR